VTHPGGLGKEVTLAISGDYLNIFETQGFHPTPSDETRDGRMEPWAESAGYGISSIVGSYLAATVVHFTLLPGFLGDEIRFNSLFRRLKGRSTPVCLRFHRMADASSSQSLMPLA